MIIYKYLTYDKERWIRSFNYNISSNLLLRDRQRYIWELIIMERLMSGIYLKDLTLKLMFNYQNEKISSFNYYYLLSKIYRIQIFQKDSEGISLRLKNNNELIKIWNIPKTTYYKVMSVIAQAAKGLYADISENDRRLINAQAQKLNELAGGNGNIEII